MRSVAELQVRGVVAKCVALVRTALVAACVLTGFAGAAAANCTFPPFFGTDAAAESCVTSITPAVGPANATIKIIGSQFKQFTWGFLGPTCNVTISSVSLAGVNASNPTVIDDNTIIVTAGSPPGNVFPSGPVVVNTTLSGSGCTPSSHGPAESQAGNFTYESQMFMTSTPSLVSQIGQPYSQANTASGGTPPYTYSVGSGNLPQGATLNTSTGLVSGTLTGAAGSFIYTIEAVDVNGQKISAGTVGSTAPPTVTSVSPSQGPAAGGQSVIITGTNFSGATVVTVDGISVPFSVLAPNPPNGQAATQISIKTPPHAAGTVDVAVTTPAGFASSSGGIYTFNPGPSVTNISPATGPLTGGQSVTITGTNFTPGSTFVTIGGVAATVGTVTGTTISATTPANVAGPQSDVVTTTFGGTGSLVNGYTNQNVPTVTAISPASGPLGGGQSVTITGQNFLGATAVSIGGSAATIVGTPTATTITATTGPHAAGLVDVVDNTPAASGGTGHN